MKIPSVLHEFFASLADMARTKTFPEEGGVCHALIPVDAPLDIFLPDLPSRIWYGSPVRYVRPVDDSDSPGWFLDLQFPGRARDICLSLSWFLSDVSFPRPSTTRDRKLNAFLDLGKDNVLLYRNYRGEVAVRRIRIVNLWNGISPYHRHEGRQWFAGAIDLERGVLRDFSLAGFLPENVWNKPEA